MKRKNLSNSITTEVNRPYCNNLIEEITNIIKLRSSLDMINISDRLLKKVIESNYVDLNTNIKSINKYIDRITDLLKKSKSKQSRCKSSNVRTAFKEKPIESDKLSQNNTIEIYIPNYILFDCKLNINLTNFQENYIKKLSKK